MTERLEFVVLDVGQGTGTFLVVYDDDTVIHTVLIDLGSERARLDAGGPSAEYVVDKLWNMEPPRLDAVIFSHSDSDHINLIPEVLSQFDTPHDEDPDKPVLHIDYVAYGGDRAKYRKGKSKKAVNMVTRCEDFMDEDESATSFAASASDFGSAGVAPFFKRGNLKLYLVVGNAGMSGGASGSTTKKRRRGTDGFAINTNSLVVLVEYRGVQFVATGDATGTTLASCNGVITDDVRRDYLDNVLMVAMPHHGSATTTFNVTGVASDVTPQDNLSEFVTRIPTRTITASAERVPTFKHPSALVMKYFWNHLKAGGPNYADSRLQGGRHFFTAYFTKKDGFTLDDGTGAFATWPRSDRWYTVQTARDVYTNLYFLGRAQAGVALPPDAASPVDELDPDDDDPPPLGVAWRYKADATGATLTPIVNRPNLLALRARIIAATHPETLRLPPWWDALDLESTDPGALATIPHPHLQGHAPPRTPRPADPRPPGAAAAPPGLGRARVIR